MEAGEERVDLRGGRGGGIGAEEDDGEPWGRLRVRLAVGLLVVAAVGRRGAPVRRTEGAAVVRLTHGGGGKVEGQRKVAERGERNGGGGGGGDVAAAERRGLGEEGFPSSWESLNAGTLQQVINILIISH
jgi:hypothetical protein